MALAKPTSPRLNHAHTLARGIQLALPLHNNGYKHWLTDVSNRGSDPNQLSYPPVGSMIWQQGPSGSTLYIPNSQMSVNKARFEGATRFSFCIGIYFNANTSGAIFSKNSNNGVMLQRFSDNVTYFRLNSTSHSVNTAANAMPLQTWGHAACRYDGSNMDIFWNGTQVARTTGVTGQSIPVDGASLLIGDSGSVIQDAVFDYFYFYDRALSDNEFGMLCEDPFQHLRPRRPVALLRSSGAASSAKFRRTLSALGSRTGARQVHLG